MSNKKWAQMTKLERAWEKLQACPKAPSYLYRDRKAETIEEKRGHNRYYQLCKHWVKLKEANETGTSSR